VTIDFSTYSGGAIDPLYYGSVGLTLPSAPLFSWGSFWNVGLVQGSNALLDEPNVTPIVGDFTAPVSTVAVSFAPGLQGTAEYTLTAFDSAGQVVAAHSIDVTQDEGEQNPIAWGYTTIDLGQLPRPATTLTLQSTFIRSSFDGTTRAGVIPFGVRTISFTVALPTTKADCMTNGWQAYGVFNNQGDCVSYVATGGKNQPTV
jgi:hypothetical protein